MKKILALVLLFFTLLSCKKEEKKDDVPVKIEEPKANIKFGYNFDNYKVIQDTIKSGESFGQILDRHHVVYPTINKIASSVKNIFDVRRVRAGKPYTILASTDSIEKAQVFIYKHDKINATILDFKDSTIVAEKFKKPIKVLEKEIKGSIQNNLSVTMDSLGIKPNLTYRVADIYAWTLDFYKLQKGDSFKIIYEEKFIDDSTFAGYGNIKSMVFKHRGRDLYAFRFVADTVRQIADYYDDEGDLLRRQFLKSPIKFQYRISSKYNLRRRIPYYGNRIRPHRGTDFAARIGTPIIATASGTVVESTRRGGNGNFVKIKHNNTYSTQYLHMRKRKVKRGDYVKQGDVIGTVGMTGNTSGPHVCYRFWKNGKEVDPFKQKLPPAKPLPKEIKDKFLEFMRPLKYQLDYGTIKGNEPQELKEIVAKN